MILEVLNDYYFDKTKLLVNKYFTKKNNKFLSFENCFSIIARIEDEVIGHALIQKNVDPYLGEEFYYIQDVCVDENYRNKGIAISILNKIEEIAKQNNIDYLLLTSNNNKVSANRLYQKLDYKIKDTNVYKKVM